MPMVTMWQLLLMLLACVQVMHVAHAQCPCIDITSALQKSPYFKGGELVCDGACQKQFGSASP